MGLLDQVLGGVLGQVLGGAQGGSRAALIQAVLGMLLQNAVGGRGGAGGGGGLTDILGSVLGGGQRGGMGGGLGGALNGGLGGLGDLFKQAGMRQQFDSWTAQGPNMAISPDQIASAFGDGQLAKLAEEAGMSTEQVRRELADILPGMVDRMTPGGAMPRQDLGADELGSWMSDVLGGGRR
jgi:uncharacterized protein YidB (DUF937 family)